QSTPALPSSSVYPFLSHPYAPSPHLHSFPTRRSSDLQTVCEGDFQLFSHRIPSFSYSSSTDFPRSLATSSGRFKLLNPVIVARMTLIGVFDPSDLVKISPTPESSITARTGPPAITPVPSAAGFINTFPEPKRP